MDDESAAGPAAALDSPPSFSLIRDGQLPAGVHEVIRSMNANVFLGEHFVLKVHTSPETRPHCSVRELVMGRYLNRIGFAHSPAGFDGLREPKGVLMRRVPDARPLSSLSDRDYADLAANGGLFCRVLRVVTEALRQLHAVGVLHGDLKPDNVMLSSGLGEAHLIDLGGALATPLTPHRTFVGPSHLTAPLPFTDPSLILSGGRRSTQNDLYSLGVTMLWLLYRVAFGSSACSEELTRLLLPVPGSASETPRGYVLEKVCGGCASMWHAIELSMRAGLRAELSSGVRLGRKEQNPARGSGRGGESLPTSAHPQPPAPSFSPCPLPVAPLIRPGEPHPQGEPAASHTFRSAGMDYRAWCEAKAGSSTGPPLPFRLLALSLDRLSSGWSARMVHSIREVVLQLLHPVSQFRPTAAMVLETLDGLLGTSALPAGRPVSMIKMASASAYLPDAASLASRYPRIVQSIPPTALIREVLFGWRVLSLHVTALTLALHARWRIVNDEDEDPERRVRTVAALACFLCLVRDPRGPESTLQLEPLVRRAVHRQDAAAIVAAMREVAELDTGCESDWAPLIPHWGVPVSELRKVSRELKEMRESKSAGGSGRTMVPPPPPPLSGALEDLPLARDVLQLAGEIGDSELESEDEL